MKRDEAALVPLTVQPISRDVLAGEVPQARRKRPRGPVCARGAGPGLGGTRSPARSVAGPLPREPACRRHRCRPHHERCRHHAAGHADQLLRPAGGRLHPGRGRGRLPGHLRSPARSGRDHAARRRRRLRLLAHPPARRRGAGHRFDRVGAVQLHRRVRPFLRHRGKRGRAPRRPDGRAAHRPPGRAGVHHRQAQAGALVQFQRLGRGDARLHGGARRRRRLVAGASRAARRRAARKGRAPARGRHVGLPHAARRRALGHGDALGLRFRRAGHPVSRHHQPRQQPALLRGHRGHQSLRDRRHLGADDRWSPSGGRAHRTTVRRGGRRQGLAESKARVSSRPATNPSCRWARARAIACA